MDLISILSIAMIFLFFVVIILGIVYANIALKESAKKSKKTNNKRLNNNSEEESTSEKVVKSYDVQSVFNFMEFDKIEDNMIIQKKGKRYVMAIECQGINYDLMSEVEKTSVESGFMQFLNTLRDPIQLYIQTRTINLESSIQTYKNKLEKIEEEIRSKENKFKQMQQSNRYTEKELKKQKMEIMRQTNLYEYGKDIIFNTERMSLNKNVLRKKYYIIIYYYYSNQENNYLDLNEVRDLAFSDLYTKAQSIIRTLGTTGVIGKVLNSYELVDLLYNAYNRDESETYGIEKALQAGYDELYITAPDILEKREKAIERKIEQQAFEVAQQALEYAKSEKQKRIEEKEENIDELINDLAMDFIKQNEKYIDKELVEDAINKIEKDKEKKKGGKADGKKERKVRNK